MDFGILYALNNIHTEVLDKIMIGITYLGEKGIFWIGVAIVLLFFQKTRKCGLFMLISMMIGLIIGNGLLKNLVARQRPCWIDQTIQLLIANPTRLYLFVHFPTDVLAGAILGTVIALSVYYFGNKIEKRIKKKEKIEIEEKEEEKDEELV